MYWILADARADKIVAILQSFSSVFSLIFQAIGVALTVYAIPSLILAMKDENANAKTNAISRLAVGVFLIAMPAIMNSFDLAAFV